MEQTDEDNPENENPLLRGELRWTVFMLALPVLGEQVLNFMVGFYDVYLAGHLDETIRTEATSAVGVAAYVGWLASMVFSLVAVGTTALVSRAWGAGDFEQVNRVANRSVMLAACAGVITSIALFISAPFLVGFMGLNGIAADISTRYLRVDSISMVMGSLSLVIAAALRGTGNMKTPMYAFSIVNVVNIIVSTILVNGLGPIPAMGVDGIVTGTLISRVVGGSILLYLLIRGTNRMKLQRRELKLRGVTVNRILEIGLPSAYEGLVTWFGHCLFLKIISELGNAEFAAHIIGVRIEAITYLPAIAWGSAAATMVGQSLGAGDEERAVRSGNIAAFQCSLLGIVITLLFLFGAEWIYIAMHGDPAVRAAGTEPFRMVSLFQVPLILGIVYFSAMKGAGDTKFPLYASLVITYLIRIPIGYYCAITLDMGLIGAWIGMSFDMFLRGVVSVWRYRSRKWVSTKV